MSECFSEKNSSGGRVEFELDLSDKHVFQMKQKI